MTSLFKNAQIDRDTEETVNGMRTATDIAEFNDPAAVDRVEASIATAFNTEVLLAKQFAEGPTRAYGATKRLLQETWSSGLEVQMDRETRSISDLTRTDDAREGISAFIEKRKPDFKGE